MKTKKKLFGLSALMLALVASFTSHALIAPEWGEAKLNEMQPCREVTVQCNNISTTVCLLPVPEFGGAVRTIYKTGTNCSIPLTYEP